MKNFSAVIKISEFDESPEEAIVSVIKNSTYFVDLHIVKTGYNTQVDLYSNWKNDLASLKECGLEPTWHSGSVDLSKLKAKAKIDIEPDMYISDGALNIFVLNMQKYHDSYDNYAVSSITTLSSDKRFIGVWSYGLLLVIMMLDVFRSYISLFKYYKTTDLRVQFLSTTYPDKV